MSLIHPSSDLAQVAPYENPSTKHNTVILCPQPKGDRSIIGLDIRTDSYQPSNTPITLNAHNENEVYVHALCYLPNYNLLFIFKRLENRFVPTKTRQEKMKMKKEKKRQFSTLTIKCPWPSMHCFRKRGSFSLFRGLSINQSVIARFAEFV